MCVNCAAPGIRGKVIFGMMDAGEVVVVLLLQILPDLVEQQRIQDHVLPLVLQLNLWLLSQLL